jgi:hypothetical protein
MSYVILRSAHSKHTRPQYNALNKIYFKTPSMHILECCFARSLQARSLRSNKKRILDYIASSGDPSENCQCCRNLWVEASEKEIRQSGKVLRKQLWCPKFIFFPKKVSTGEGGRRDLKCCCSKTFFGPTWVFAAPPDQKSWLRLWPSIIKLNNLNQFLYLRKHIVNLCSFHKHKYQ